MEEEFINSKPENGKEMTKAKMSSGGVNVNMVKEIEDLKGVIEELRKKLLYKIENGDVFEINEKIIRKSQDLKSKYGEKEVLRYRLYHLLIGSTPGHDVDLYDFPGEDSIEKFIEEEL